MKSQFTNKLFILRVMLFPFMAINCYADEAIEPIVSYFRIIAVDENENKVPDASIKVFNYSDQDREQPKGFTNKVGEFIVTCKKSLLTQVDLEKNGYYSTRSIEIPLSAQVVDKELTMDPVYIQIKRVKSPIPMVAKNLTREAAGPLRLPESIQEAGYDLLIGDWVKPYGNGQTTDMIIRHKVSYSNDGNFSSEVKIKFPNEKDGLIPFLAPISKGSELKSDYYAPEDGYLQTWTQVRKRNSNGENINTENDERNFYFRVRSKVDEDGEIINANYGKIYGEFMSFVYYFNPKDNDRNIEFDPSRNLLKSIDTSTKVTQP